MEKAVSIRQTCEESGIMSVFSTLTICLTGHTSSQRQGFDASRPTPFPATHWCLVIGLPKHADSYPYHAEGIRVEGSKDSSGKKKRAYITTDGIYDKSVIKDAMHHGDFIQLSVGTKEFADVCFVFIFSCLTFCLNLFHIETCHGFCIHPVDNVLLSFVYIRLQQAQDSQNNRPLSQKWGSFGCSCQNRFILFLFFSCVCHDCVFSFYFVGMRCQLYFSSAMHKKKLTEKFGSQEYWKPLASDADLQHYIEKVALSVSSLKKILFLKK